MIEPFEYEKKHMKPSVTEGVTDGGLDTSLLDRPIQKLNNFSRVSDFDHYLSESSPYTKAHQERVGRVHEEENNKSDFQSEAIAQLGSLVSGYDTVKEDMGDGNASEKLHKYLDREVGFIPTFRETIQPIENVKVDEPVLQPGISFVDSRKNVATGF